VSMWKRVQILRQHKQFAIGKNELSHIQKKCRGKLDKGICFLLLSLAFPSHPILSQDESVFPVDRVTIAARSWSLTLTCESVRRDDNLPAELRGKRMSPVVLERVKNVLFARSHSIRRLVMYDWPLATGPSSLRWKFS
jgi:hypothetical protein